MKYEPSELLTASRKFPDSWLVTVTVTPGSDPACWSVTLPRISAVPCCATALDAKERKTRKRTTTARPTGVFMSPPWMNVGRPRRECGGLYTGEPGLIHKIEIRLG